MIAGLVMAFAMAGPQPVLASGSIHVPAEDTHRVTVRCPPFGMMGGTPAATATLELRGIRRDENGGFLAEVSIRRVRRDGAPYATAARKSLTDYVTHLATIESVRPMCGEDGPVFMIRAVSLSEFQRRLSDDADLSHQVTASASMTFRKTDVAVEEFDDEVSGSSN